MKYFKRLDVYKNHNGSNKVSLTNKAAYSYNWWKYFAEIELSSGKKLTVFNDTYYSSTTTRHQWQAKSLLRENNVEIDLALGHTRISLRHPREAIKREIKYYTDSIFENLSVIDNKGTTKKKNNERVEDINKSVERIRELKSILKQIKVA